MYEHKGLEDIFFIMLYGGAALLALAACCYLLFTRGNLFLFDVKPHKTLRRWAAAFMASVVASHVWWAVLGISVLEDDRLLRNIVAITLDRLTFVPLMMVVLLRMLQDRKRSLWPVAVAMVPIAVIAVMSIVTRDDRFEYYTETYSALLALSFIIYYVHAVKQYGRWLRDNYADLEHKEVWQSLVLISCILFVYVCYTSNEGALFTEYLGQMNTLVIIGFVLWRVETLQELKEAPQEPASDAADDATANIPSLTEKDTSFITELLATHCESAQLYLQHDLSLPQLAAAIGTNRTYLSNYFGERNITYNFYINHLRIEHFIRLYKKSADLPTQPTAKFLAVESGFRSYATFGVAFKKHTGYTVTEWMKLQEIAT